MNQRINNLPQCIFYLVWLVGAICLACYVYLSWPIGSEVYKGHEIPVQFFIYFLFISGLGVAFRNYHKYKTKKLFGLTVLGCLYIAVMLTVKLGLIGLDVQYTATWIYPLLAVAVLFDK